VPPLMSARRVKFVFMMSPNKTRKRVREDAHKN
jgi:hypothetical protein